MSTLDKNKVQEIAHLARLQLSANETKKYHQELNTILDLVSQMAQCDTENIAPMSHPQDITLVMRPDISEKNHGTTILQQLAPEAENGLYLVPKVIE